MANLIPLDHHLQSVKVDHPDDGNKTIQQAVDPRPVAMHLWLIQVHVGDQQNPLVRGDQSELAEKGMAHPLAENQHIAYRIMWNQDRRERQPTLLLLSSTVD